MANTPEIEKQFEDAIKDPRYDGTRYALLCDYRYFSGNHAAEIACKEGENWEWFYIPCPTEIFSKHYGPEGDKAGQRPLACQVEESGTLYYGTLDEMTEKMKKFDRPMVLFQL